MDPSPSAAERNKTMTVWMIEFLHAGESCPRPVSTSIVRGTSECRYKRPLFSLYRIHFFHQQHKSSYPFYLSIYLSIYAQNVVEAWNACQHSSMAHRVESPPS